MNQEDFNKLSKQEALDAILEYPKNFKLASDEIQQEAISALLRKEKELINLEKNLERQLGLRTDYVDNDYLNIFKKDSILYVNIMPPRNVAFLGKLFEKCFKK